MSSRAKPARYRARPAPRARTRRGSRTRIDWDRLGRIVLVLVLFGILFSYVGPGINFLDAWRDARAERAQLAELKSEHESLRKRVAQLEEPDVAERAARKLGMVAEGESSYVIRSLR